VRDACFVGASEGISVGEVVCALATLKRVDPVSFVLVAIAPHMDAIPPNLVVLPLPLEGGSVGILPDSVAELLAAKPLSVVDLAVVPAVDALPRRLVVLVGASVDVTVLEFFVALAIALVFQPGSFINPTVVVEEDSKSFSLLGLQIE